MPREAVDEAIGRHGRAARRRDGKLPPHVMVYFVMAMALFADEDYEQVAARLAGALVDWGCWDEGWSVPSSGGISQARARLGPEPLESLFEQVAVLVADALTRGAWCAGRRLMAIDGLEWDAPDTPANVAGFGYAGSAQHGSPLPKVRVVAVSECGSPAVVAAAMAGTRTGEQVLARQLWSRLEAGWLVTADRNFFSWVDWHAATRTGADLLWRVGANMNLPVVQALPDGSWIWVVVSPAVRNATTRARRRADAAAGRRIDPEQAMLVRVVEYTVPDRPTSQPGTTIRLLTTIHDPAEANAVDLARAYQQRWEQETAHQQLKTHLRGPGRVLRSRSPTMVAQEIWGYLLTHYAISALICQAATQADIDPDRVKFLRTVRIVRRHIGESIPDPAAFPPSSPDQT